MSAKPRPMGIDPETWRTYRLATELKIPPGAGEDVSAVLLDELLEVHRVVEEVKAAHRG